MGLHTRWPTGLFKYGVLLWGMLALAGCHRGDLTLKAPPVPTSGENRVMEAPALPQASTPFMEMPAWYREALRVAQAETRHKSGFVRGYW